MASMSKQLYLRELPLDPTGITTKRNELIAPQSQALDPTTERFYRAQVVNSARNALALRPFRYDEFGTNPGAPSTAHVESANRLVQGLQQHLGHVVDRLGRVAIQQDSAALLRYREHAERHVKIIEKIWAFYLELFGQRQTPFAKMLLAADRIALDSYQAIFMGLPIARSIPSPSPFSYMETGFTPATFRRGIPLSRISKQINPFPIVSLPYHRLVNPWTLGAISHEVSHNLQSDLGLWEEVPQRINTRLRAAKVNKEVVGIWVRWHKEMWADLCGLLLSGPAVVASLLDVVARSPLSTTAFNPHGVHPTSYFRVLINTELLRRMGFPKQAADFERLWKRLYPNPLIGGIPSSMMTSFPRACKLVVDTICFQPYQQLGGKTLAEVVCFRPTHYKMTEEAAVRLARGIDPGIIPARFLIGAARLAFDRQLATPDFIAQHFYAALTQR
jgi:hypothetical protein